MIICTKCGQVHSVNVAKKIYVGPEMEAKLEATRCAGCQSFLGQHWAPYPENFMKADGGIGQMERPIEMPDDSDSVIRTYPEIYV